MLTRFLILNHHITLTGNAIVWHHCWQRDSVRDMGPMQLSYTHTPNTTPHIWTVTVTATTGCSTTESVSGTHAHSSRQHQQQAGLIQPLSGQLLSRQSPGEVQPEVHALCCTAQGIWCQISSLPWPTVRQSAVHHTLAKHQQRLEPGGSLAAAAIRATP